LYTRKIRTNNPFGHTADHRGEVIAVSFEDVTFNVANANFSAIYI
jgi:hypothetical protein